MSEKKNIISKIGYWGIPLTLLLVTLWFLIPTQIFVSNENVTRTAFRFSKGETGIAIPFTWAEGHDFVLGESDNNTMIAVNFQSAHDLLYYRVAPLLPSSIDQGLHGMYNKVLSDHPNLPLNGTWDSEGFVVVSCHRITLEDVGHISYGSFEERVELIKEGRLYEFWIHIQYEPYNFTETVVRHWSLLDILLRKEATP
jgi:hypothetical protein